MSVMTTCSVNSLARLQSKGEVDGMIVGPEISGSWNYGSVNGSNSQRWQEYTGCTTCQSGFSSKRVKTRLLNGQDGDHTMTSSNTSNIKELDGSFVVPTQPINSMRHDIPDKKFMAHLPLLQKQTSQHDIRMLRMDACYLELKVPSRSRRDGSCDFLDRYRYHYRDAIARPLLSSEVVEILLHKMLIFFVMPKVPDVDTSASSIAFQIKNTCNGQRSSEK
ncbi:hypothetical protein Tco_0096590 [Tanacetum coccineum]